jgi:hypothetical protein
MAFEATMRHGDPTMMNYTPTGGDVAAGQVVSLGGNTGLSCGIAHLDIANNVQGALAIGGGVYDVTMLTNIAPYAKVYWDDTNNKVVSTTTLIPFGYLLEGNTGANTVVKCLHVPQSAS